MPRTRHILIAAAMVLAASTVQAGHYCQHCGCHRNCRKICRLECGKKKETKIEYSAECEDFCVPGPSKKCGVKVDCDCNGRHHRTILWQPTCANVHTRTQLVKNEVTKEVPDYKWIVEEYCCVCGHCVKVTGNEKPEGGNQKAQRLPLTIANADVQNNADDRQPDDFGAYFVDAETEAGDDRTLPALLPAEAELGETSLDEPSADAAPREPRRLFSGLFGR